MANHTLQVLVIDDSETDFFLIADALESSDLQCEVAWARGYDAGLEALTQRHHDIFLTEDHLASGSGLELFEHARAVGIDTPSILLAQDPSRHREEKALQAGAADYIFKAELAPEVLARAVRYALERQRLQGELVRAATHDGLTGLANRRLLSRVLRRELLRCARSGGVLAVLFVDLDHFKAVNDQLGHDQGDALLKVVAERLQACVRTGDLVARLGGDEFAIVLHDLDDQQDAGVVAGNIINALGVSVALTQSIAIGASVGIAVSTTGSDTPQELMKAADIALYTAKAQGRNNYQYFARHMQEEAVSKARIRTELTSAIASEGFRLAYQPQVEGFSGRVVGMECLIRWNHGGQERSPAHFIPVAEECGFIEQIGDWVLATACRRFQGWIEEGIVPNGVTLSVNVSVHQLRHESILAGLERALADTGLDSHRLELEITETARLSDLATASSVLQCIQDMGVRIALDDFGTGYSALANLKDLPVQGLKLDRTFVQGALTNKTDAALLNATIAFAHTLGLSLIAEGVETPAQRQLLLRSRCALMQGWLFYGALSDTDMRNLLVAECRMAARHGARTPPSGLLRLLGNAGLPQMSIPAGAGQAQRFG